MSFPMPEKLQTPTGEPRRVGVELEFAGMSLTQISTLVADLYGGQIEVGNSFVHTVKNTRWGDFQIEIDTALLKNRAYRPYLEAVGIELEETPYRDRVEDIMARVAGTVVPHEVVTPPIPMNELHELETLRDALRQAKAKGTRHSVLYAFGLHLNPELAENSGACIFAHLRAFLLLWDWLFIRGEIDWSRRITPFIKEFPDDYRRLVLTPEYAPDDRQLLTDYLSHNPTRNRPLDLLPVFLDIFGNVALEGVEEAALVKPRPAFHYRLPNCRIDEPEWTLAQEWQGWVTVEWLAARPEKMLTMAEAWIARKAPMFASVDREWATETENWLI